MELYGQRKREQHFVAREAAGENVWTSRFSGPVRHRLLAAITDEPLEGSSVPSMAARLIYEGLGREIGTSWKAFRNYFILTKEDDLIPSLLEALVAAIRYQWGDKLADSYCEAVATILAQERIAFDFVDGVMVDFDSREMHDAVVRPALVLLAGKHGWENVENAYRKALEEIGDDPGDAITDAGTALQEGLKAAGAEGNAIGALAKSARAKRLFTGYDGKVADAMRDLCDWVAADRSTKGDAHNADPATREDAWLAVHIVGALLIRLAGATPRD